MQCPKCSGKGRIYGTQNYGTTVQRYHRCSTCDHRWRSWEEKDGHVVKTHQKRVPSAVQDDFLAKLEGNMGQQS